MDRHNRDSAAVRASQAVLSEAVQRCQSYGYPEAVVIAALLDVTGQVLVDQVGRRCAAELLERLILEIAEGVFGLDEPPQQKPAEEGR